MFLPLHASFRSPHVLLLHKVAHSMRMSLNKTRGMLTWTRFSKGNTSMEELVRLESCLLSRALDNSNICCVNSHYLENLIAISCLDN